jgi:hypothetical protein
VVACGLPALGLPTFWRGQRLPNRLGIAPPRRPGRLSAEAGREGLTPYTRRIGSADRSSDAGVSGLADFGQAPARDAVAAPGGCGVDAVLLIGVQRTPPRRLAQRELPRPRAPALVVQPDMSSRTRPASAASSSAQVTSHGRVGCFCRAARSAPAPRRRSRMPNAATKRRAPAVSASGPTRTEPARSGASTKAEPAPTLARATTETRPVATFGPR